MKTKELKKAIKAFNDKKDVYVVLFNKRIAEEYEIKCTHDNNGHLQICIGKVKH